MVSTIFSTEISSLESEVAALQAQIAAAQQRMTALGECEAQTDGAIQALTSAVQKVSALAPDALATLKSAVFALFNSDGSDGDGGLSITPAPITPATQPDLNGQTCEIDPDAYWEIAAPDNSSWELATPLCCQMEDIPTVSLRGQVYEQSFPIQQNVTAIYKDFESIPAKTEAELVEAELVEQPYAELVKVSDAVAYMRRRDGEVIAVYAGGSNKGKLRNWGDWLTRIHSVTHGYEIRVGKRLGTKWEIKLTSMSLAQIERLAACDFSKDPRTNYPDAPKRPVERVPSIREIEGIGIGDIVRSTTVKNWQYKVTKIDSDNFLVCDRIGASPSIIQTLHPGSVELVLKADTVDVVAQELSAYIEQQAQDAIASIQEPLSQAVKIDRDDVPAGTRLFPISDDLLTEFEVWMQTEVRVMGRTQRQQKQVGLLIQTAFGIEAYRSRASVCKVFTKTLDAVAYLIQGSGLKPLPIAEEPVLVGTATIDDEF